ncbi:dUTP diphosphatase [Edaphovirga cremea]|uniref:dUTP diphosphatase n=1 Tax=Edaphovirga cremea TaxID=2267246 RepID=UPI0039890655
MSQTSPFQKVTNFQFTQIQIQKLLDMQGTLNTYIHPQWQQQNFNFGLAINDEVMEIHGHLGWKWWKEGHGAGLTKSNLTQVKLEVIDILHFVLSHVFDGWDCDVIIDYFNCDLYNHSTLEEILDYNIAERDNGTYMIEAWAALARYVGLTEHEIIQTYTQKYVLNKFRQDHGYKDGSYKKHWCIGVDTTCGGDTDILQEDNEFLAQLVMDTALMGGDITDELELYNGLELGYNSRLNK